MQFPDAQHIRDATSILDDLRRVVRKLRESSREAEQRLGVTGAQLFVLRTLSSADEALSVNDLATRTRTHQSTVSVVVSRLVERNFVARRPSPVDARRVELSLTDGGRELLDQAPLAAQDDLIIGIERMARDRRSELANSLRALVVAMDLEAQEPEMFFEDNGPSLGKKLRASAPKAPRRRPQRENP